MIANPRGAWRAFVLLLTWRVIIKFKVQCSKFKVKMFKVPTTMNILLRLPCPPSFPSSLNS